jgi:hypothetical protein
MRAMNADSVIDLNRTAARRYTRSLSSKLIDRLDDDGINLVQLAVPNGDSDHLHVLMMLKLTGRDEPLTAWLDISYADFNKLSDVSRDENGEYVVTKAEATA